MIQRIKTITLRIKFEIFHKKESFKQKMKEVVYLSNYEL